MRLDGGFADDQVVGELCVARPRGEAWRPGMSECVQSAPRRTRCPSSSVLVKGGEQLPEQVSQHAALAWCQWGQDGLFTAYQSGHGVVHGSAA